MIGVKPPWTRAQAYIARSPRAQPRRLKRCKQSELARVYATIGKLSVASCLSCSFARAQLWTESSYMLWTKLYHFLIYLFLCTPLYLQFFNTRKKKKKKALDWLPYGTYVWRQTFAMETVLSAYGARVQVDIEYFFFFFYKKGIYSLWST